MAETTTAANNKPVAFGKKIAAAAAPSPDEEAAAIEKSAVRGPTGPRAPSGAAKSASIRKKAKSVLNKGMISEKAAKKFLSNV